MIRYLTISCAFVLLLSGSSFAQLVPDKWTVYKEGPGVLRSSSVTAVAIDSSGRAWCTPLKGGVMGVRDGQWVSLDPPGGTRDAFAPALAVGKNDALWMAFGGDDGISLWDGSTMRTITKKNSALPSNNVLAISCDAIGTAYIATDNGFCVIDTTGTFRVITEEQQLPARVVAMLACSPSGQLWLGFGKRTGVASWDGNKFTVYDEHNSHFPASHAFAISAENNGGAWVGTDGGGLVHIDSGTTTLYTVANSGLPDNNINAVAADHRGGVWCATQGGLAHFDGTSWVIRSMNASQLPNDHVNAVAVDGKGSVWVGTEDGLAKLVPGDIDK
jgi:ligand-binding sensor domain-containing protein